jgi:DNA-binding sugar fermentation-stimulating protein
LIFIPGLCYYKTVGQYCFNSLENQLLGCEPIEPIKLYANFEETFFVERENRFVMQLKKAEGQTIFAYIANPGRMEEFLTPSHPFFITPGNNGKYFYRVVSAFYQGSYTLLDTGNHITCR